jgi:hypothetical protein
MAATTQPNAIHSPPSRIQSMFRRIETGGMRLLVKLDWRGFAPSDPARL